MKLCYWQQPGGNFGDDLNPIIWPRLLPGVLDEDDRSLFLGIGTLLTAELPKKPVKVVFGSGAWFGRPLPVLDRSFRVYFVRGPMTAEVLGLSKAAAVTDPAILVRDVVPAPARKLYKVSYMPHHWSQELGNWRVACEEAGVHYIDPGRPVPEVLADLAASELLITEAMHGAIVADALRVPWLAVRSYRHILSFKWMDWCSSLGLEYRPAYLPSLWDARPTGGLVRRLTGGVKKRLVVRKLRELGRGGAPQLSPDHRLEAASARLQERIARLQTDVRASRPGSLCASP